MSRTKFVLLFSLHLNRSRKFRPLSHEDIVQLVKQRRQNQENCQQSQCKFEEDSQRQKKRPLAHILKNKYKTQQYAPQQLQEIEKRIDSVTKFSLEVNFKQAQIAEWRMRQDLVNINLDTIQSIGDEDILKDGTIFDLRMNVNPRQINTIISPQPLHRKKRQVLFDDLMPNQYQFEVVHNLPTHKMQCDDGQMDCLFLKSCLYPSLLNVDIQKYQNFISRQIDQLYSLQQQMQTYKLKVQSYVTIGHAQTLQKISAQYRQLMQQANIIFGKDQSELNEIYDMVLHSEYPEKSEVIQNNNGQWHSVERLENKCHGLISDSFVIMQNDALFDDALSQDDSSGTRAQRIVQQI